MFSWRQSQPRSEVAATLEIRRVYRDRHGNRGNWSNAGDRSETLADWVGLMLFQQLPVDRLDLQIEFSNVSPHLSEHRPSTFRDGSLICQNADQRRNIAAALGRDDTEFTGMAT